MKKATLALLIGSTLMLSACGSDKKEESKDATVEQNNQDASTAMMSEYNSEAQQHSYALGASMGMFAKNRLAIQESLSIEVDQDALMAGFNDAMAGNMQFSDEDIQGFAQASDMKLRQAQSEESAKLTAETKAEGAAFLAKNAEREDVTVTDSGLQYEVITKGSGASPKAEDEVKVHYKGTLINGTEFDSSYSRGEPTSFPLNRVISGWTEGLQLMKEGGTYRFYIPSELAYGEREAGSIPPHSTLIFDVELLEVNPAK